VNYERRNAYLSCHQPPYIHPSIERTGILGCDVVSSDRNSIRWLLMPKKARGTRAQMAFVTGMRLDLRKRGGRRMKEQTKKKKKNVRFESSRSLKNFGAIFIFIYGIPDRYRYKYLQPSTLYDRHRIKQDQLNL